MTRTLTWPLRVDRGRLASTPQDSEADIVSCVGAILRTPPGWRLDRPDFGRPAGVQFAMNGTNLDALTAKILDQDDRATPEIVRDALTTNRDQIRVDSTGESA